MARSLISENGSFCVSGILGSTRAEELLSYCTLMVHFLTIIVPTKLQLSIEYQKTKTGIRCYLRINAIIYDGLLISSGTCVHNI